MNQDTILISFLILFAGAIATLILRGRYRHEFTVNEGFAGLLYQAGKLVATLGPGLHVRWGRNLRIAFAETRQTLLTIPGQEVLTADNIAVKISTVLTTQVTDAAKSVQTVDNHIMHLYNAAQAALRSVIAGVTLEALLTQRASFAPQLLELITPQAEAIGVKIHAVDLRDVMLPGDLRKAFSDVLKARQEGQAALERARGETAALRNLANAARLVESQPVLTTLRFLQTLEGKSQTIVMNDLSLLAPTTRHSSASTDQK
jgi:regulator of protease activity HflC (stomatin/prohibitin superfamily)